MCFKIMKLYISFTFRILYYILMLIIMYTHIFLRLDKKYEKLLIGTNLCGHVSPLEVGSNRREINAAFRQSV